MKMDPADPRHGTNAGYMAHRLTYGEKPCAACQQGHTDYARKLRAKRYLNRVERLQVDATGTRRRLQALSAIGWPWPEINVRLGYKATTQRVSHMLRSERVHIDTHRKVKALYEELCMTPGPSSISRGRAIRKGWAPPLAWDDIDHDIAPVDVKRCKSGRHILSETRNSRGECGECVNEAKRLRYARLKGAAA